MTWTFDEIKTYVRSRDNFESGKGASEQELRELEQLWSVVPHDYRQYLSTYGWMSFDSYDFLGLGSSVPDYLHLIRRASLLWSGSLRYKIPRHLLPFYEPGGEWYYCFDNKKNNKVVCWAQEYEDLGEPQPYDETYDSWSEWFEKHIVA